PKKRLHDIADANLWLEDAATPISPALPHQPRRSRTWPAWVVAGAALLAAIIFAFVYFRQEAPLKEAVRFEIWPPEKTMLSDVFSVSPDGRKLAFIASSDRARIWVRSLETLEAQALAGTEDVNGTLFWSPDSRFVAYFANRQLRKIEAAGGPS